MRRFQRSAILPMIFHYHSVKTSNPSAVGASQRKASPLICPALPAFRSETHTWARDQICHLMLSVESQSISKQVICHARLCINSPWIIGSFDFCFFIWSNVSDSGSDRTMLQVISGSSSPSFPIDVVLSRHIEQSILVTSYAARTFSSSAPEDICEAHGDFEFVRHARPHPLLELHWC